MMQKYDLYPSMINFENLIEINKILKVNIIVYDKEYKAVYGFCQDNVDCNVFKSYTPLVQYDYQSKYIGTMQPNFPNFAAFTKDISFIYKTANVNTAKVGVDIFSYGRLDTEYAHRFGVKAFRSTIIDEERPCFDYKFYQWKMHRVLTDMACLPNTEAYMDIQNISAFKDALSASADKGIQTVHYENNIYFIAPTFINMKKDERIDLIAKNDNTLHIKILDFKIHKKHGVVDVIYKQVLI